jgi:glutaredoxin
MILKTLNFRNIFMNEPTEKQKKDLRRIKIAIIVMFSICAVLGAYVYWQGMPPPAGLYDALAKCISQSSTTFYGASWCPHCAEQKTKFGTGAQYLPYVECAATSTAGGQTQVCIDHNITNYPTWVFADGSRLVGVQTPQTLAQKTGCTL